MRLQELLIHQLDIPFRVSFKHSSAERSQTAGVWVTARSQSGGEGYGEGCPRDYVTGENIEGANAFLSRYSEALIRDVVDLDSLRDWVNQHTREINDNPAAWCAAELALLDLLAKDQACSVESLLGLPELEGVYHYSAVIGDSEIEAFRKIFGRYRAMGFTDFKLKISGDAERDFQKIEALRGEQNPALRVRVDANNLWKSPTEGERYLQALDYPFFAVEEPLEAGDHSALARFAASTESRVILDESFLRVEQFPLLSGDPNRWIINLRISKMGGLIRSLQVCERARSEGISIIIGAQVGETSLLTRAALTVANSSRDLLIAQEGAFGTLLLERDVCDPPLMFGPRGELAAESLAACGAPGFGISLCDGLDFFRPIA